jgi:iron complex outermembrane receptor protein
VATVIQANPALKPEKSSSYSFGLILSPASGLSLSFDRWYVMRKEFIDKLDPSVILRNELTGGFIGGFSTRDPRPETWLPGVPNSGPVIAIVQQFNNFGATGASGLDVSASARWNIPSFGRMTVEGDATYYDKLVWKLNPNGAYISGLGNFFIFESPRFRARASLVWDYGAISLLTRYNYTGGWDYGQATQDNGLSSGAFQCYFDGYVREFGRCYVEAFETWDIGASWTGVKNLKLSLLVRNVTDKAAPLDPGRIPLGFNPVFHNPYGRYLQFSLSYRFK